MHCPRCGRALGPDAARLAIAKRALAAHLVAVHAPTGPELRALHALTPRAFRALTHPPGLTTHPA